jgi:hypothetical protein
MVRNPWESWLALILTQRKQDNILTHYLHNIHFNSIFPSMPSHRPLTSEDQVHAQVGLCGICGGQSGTETGFSLNSSFFPYQHHSTRAKYIHIYILKKSGVWKIGPLEAATQRQSHFTDINNNMSSIQNIVFAVFAGIFKIHLCKQFHMLCSSTSLVTQIKLRTKYIFYMDAMLLLCILNRIFFRFIAIQNFRILRKLR